MFTGIIETTGKVKKVSDGRLIIGEPKIARKLKDGGSVAIDGACFTAVGITDTSFSVDFMPETERKTIVGSYKTGTKVNLEMPMPAYGRFDGHIVTGHVDCTGELQDVSKEENSYVLSFSVPKEFSKYIVEKGSITVNGISLTVASVNKNIFSVCIIPHTWEITNLNLIKIGGKVNIETDILGKYVEKLAKK